MASTSLLKERVSDKSGADELGQGLWAGRECWVLLAAGRSARDERISAATRQ